MKSRDSIQDAAALDQLVNLYKDALSLSGNGRKARASKAFVSTRSRSESCNLNREYTWINLSERGDEKEKHRSVATGKRLTLDVGLKLGKISSRNSVTNNSPSSKQFFKANASDTTRSCKQDGGESQSSSGCSTPMLSARSASSQPSARSSASSRSLSSMVSGTYSSDRLSTVSLDSSRSDSAAEALAEGLLELHSDVPLSTGDLISENLDNGQRRDQPGSTQAEDDAETSSNTDSRSGASSSRSSGRISWAEIDTIHQIRNHSDNCLSFTAASSRPSSAQGMRRDQSFQSYHTRPASSIDVGNEKRLRRKQKSKKRASLEEALAMSLTRGVNSRSVPRPMVTAVEVTMPMVHFDDAE